MPAVLVHGVPETSSVWDDLKGHLHRSDILTPSLPGFGTPLPEGFVAIKDGYVDWLIAELESIGEPVDLVGHDWGGGFVVRLVSLRPDLVRSWVTDAAALADPAFEWHDFAKIWQTEGAGEDFWAGMLAAAPAERAAVFEASSVPPPAALELADGVDATMAECILALYRSATRVQQEWGPAFADIPAPGLVLVPPEDAFLVAEQATRAGARAGARVQLLEGMNHWWMLQDPQGGAAVLESFWSD
jgi:pimeloyl-ACP methyl ester carboxylesterase